MIQYWLKGTDRAVIRQYFVNFVTLRIRYLFSTVSCPQNPLNSLFDSSSTDLSPKICCFEWLPNTHALGYLEMRLILSHFIEFLILGALPKSFISDFVLKSGKTPYKEYRRYSWFKKGQLRLTLSQKWCDEVNISCPYFEEL